MFQSSYIELSTSALQHNIRFIESLIGPDVTFSSVIKGNAYGHGIEQFAPLAQSCGISHFSVFSADEALRLQQALPRPATIVIMGYIDTPELEWAVAHDIEFFVFEPDRLAHAARAAKKVGKPARIHLELETGMNRTGFDAGNLPTAEKILQENSDYLTLAGICTHYAGAESHLNHERVLNQQKLFREKVTQLKARGFVPEMLHTACSAAMVTFPETHMNLVRVGIMQYGLWPSPEIYEKYLRQHPEPSNPLRRIISWKSRIMSLKQVYKGEYIGYGASFQAPQDMVLAIVPVGYAWGYSRSLSNQGQVLIRGKRASVAGIVNMNVMMVDVTEIPDVKKDDEVVLLGHQYDESITVASFAELSTQLNYELLTRLPLNIPRFVVD
ncbi:alanine racemase [Pontibacter sp. Tf4]|uniref:alanine racemase n=1 Tax=Pontibacter sp. Tf4 TaxID=2761620 RepID=UPI0016261096|nr:alanine racemase [Pontibacter sp. Tf4]MBB6610189.1 alanine racemase [Pontibacter sp. Tf4]